MPHRVIHVEVENNPDEMEKMLRDLNEKDRSTIEKIFIGGHTTHEGMLHEVRECRSVLERNPDNDYIRFCLAQLLYETGQSDEAEGLVRDCLKRTPNEPELHIELGKILESKGLSREAVKEFELAGEPSKYIPFYLTTYAKCLNDIGQKKDACKVYHRELDRFKDRGIITSAGLLDGAFQQVILLDMDVSQHELKEDLGLYKSFLKRIQMDNELRGWLSDTIVQMSLNLGQRWLRPVFIDFVSFVDENGFLTMEPYCNTVSSAYTAEESWRYHEDGRISSLMETLLSYHHAKKPIKIPSEYEKENASESLEDYRKQLAYKYYLCVTYEKHKSEIQIIKTTYPNTYVDYKDFFNAIEEKGCDELTRELKKELLDLIPSKDIKKTEDELDIYAHKASLGNKTGLNYTGDTYIAPKKIMPNDPCPCGSGKKYKKCCGR